MVSILVVVETVFCILSDLSSIRQSVSLVSNQRDCYDLRMRLRGQIRNGKIVLEGHDVLPDGAEVVVDVRESAPQGNRSDKVQFPLFHSKNPGSLDLSNQRIAEILEDEELSAGR